MKKICAILIIQALLQSRATSQTSTEPPLAAPPSGIPNQTIDPNRAGPDSSPMGLSQTLENTGTFNPQDPPSPVVTLRVRVPASVSPGGEAVYRIHVDNISPATAHRVRVRNPIPNNARFISADPKPDNDGTELTWLFGSLKPGEQRLITMVLQADGKGDIENTARVSFEHGQTTKTRVASAIKLEKKSPERAMVFDSWTYSIDVINTGTSAISDIVVTDTIPDGLEFLTSNPSTKGENPLTWNIGKLDPGQHQRIDYQVTAKKSGEFLTTAKLTANGGIVRESACKVIVGESKLKMYKSGPDKRAVGRPATYHITIENDGQTQIKNIRISSKVDPSFVMLAASGGGRLVGTDVFWEIPYLEPGNRKTVQMVIRSSKAGELVSRAECVGDKLSQGLQGEKSTIFEKRADWALEIDKTVDPIDVNEKATYTIKIINFGQVPVNSSSLIVSLPENWRNGTGKFDQRTVAQSGSTITFPIQEIIQPGRELQFQVLATPMMNGKGSIKAELVSGGVIMATSSETIQVLPSRGSASLP
ncbi:MAG: hypothetical protein ACKO9Z_09875 [Planctomycetota bacterium]